jgi:hypothetical protein
MSPTASPPKPDNRSRVNEIPEEPPEETFWQRYSPHYEFPLSNIASIAVHVLALLGVIYLTTKLIKKPDVPTVPVKGIKIGSGDRGGIVGGPGGGSDSSKREAQDDEPQDKPRDIPEVELNQRVDKIQALIPDVKFDPAALQKIAQSPNFQGLERLNEDSRRRLAEKLAGKSGTGGSGDATGDGSNKGPGKGPGDATTSGSRSMRWTIIFKTNSGKDYLKQLGAFKAKLLIPEPPKFKTNRFFDDISQPNEGKPLKGQDLPGMEFTDGDAASASKVARALGLDYDPPYFTAFFPKEVEDELAAKERSYRNRREDQIFSTTFRVIERNGDFVITVTDQQVSKR